MFSLLRDMYGCFWTMGKWLSNRLPSLQCRKLIHLLHLTAVTRGSSTALDQKSMGPASAAMTHATGPRLLV